MRAGNRPAVVAGALILAALAPAPAAAGSVHVTLAPPRLALGQVAELSFEVTRSDLSSIRLGPRFQLDNFEIVGGPAKTDSMTWVNGELSHRMVLTWYLAPQRPGKARVYGLALVAGKQSLPLPDQEAWVDEVGAAGAAPRPDDGNPPNRSGDPFAQLFRDLFPQPPTPATATAEPQILLRAELTPANPWAGQQLVYTLYLLAERRPPGEGRVVVETIFPRRVPRFQGFWSQEIQLPESGQAEMVELDGKLWWRQAILQRALFPYEPGAHPIESAEADLRLVYFRPLGFGLGEEPVRPGAVRRVSNALTVAVRALPPAPAGFGGAVGQLRARVRLSPDEVRAGEAAILTAELTGSGNLNGLPDPRLADLPGVQLSPAQESTRQRVDGTRVDATRSWTWTLVPRRAGQWRLPPLEWVTFDPVAGAYRTLRTEPQQLAALPPAPVPAAGPAAASRRQPQGSPLCAPLLWGVAGATGALALVGLVALAQRWRGRDGKARKQLLAQVTAALGQTQPRHAAGAAEAAWRSFLGARFHLPTETPPTQWPTLLARRGLGPALAGEVVRLVDDLHYLRYAPQLASTESLQRELLERSRRLARRLA
ncbi:MAG TPA: BatD family protein [Thermoanaerobaculia bacterium]|jgi:hypothetical protein|nr:BatD family protein [Thermoanaerobaculia bacterium]